MNLVDNGSVRDAGGNPLQGGPGSFALQNQQTFAAGSSSGFVATSDVNADGKPDLIIANDLAGSAGAVSVLLGNGNGTFANRQTFAAGSNPYFVAVADVNGDGKLDLVVANQTSTGTVSVLLGNGNGTFAAPQSFTIGVNPRLRRGRGSEWRWPDRSDHRQQQLRQRAAGKRQWNFSCANNVDGGNASLFSCGRGCQWRCHAGPSSSQSRFHFRKRSAGQREWDVSGATDLHRGCIATRNRGGRCEWGWATRPDRSEQPRLRA